MLFGMQMKTKWWQFAIDELLSFPTIKNNAQPDSIGCMESRIMCVYRLENCYKYSSEQTKNIYILGFYFLNFCIVEFKRIQSVFLPLPRLFKAIYIIYLVIVRFNKYNS